MSLRGVASSAGISRTLEASSVVGLPALRALFISASFWTAAAPRPFILGSIVSTGSPALVRVPIGAVVGSSTG